MCSHMSSGHNAVKDYVPATQHVVRDVACVYVLNSLIRSADALRRQL